MEPKAHTSTQSKPSEERLLFFRNKPRLLIGIAAMVFLIILAAIILPKLITKTYKFENLTFNYPLSWEVSQESGRGLYSSDHTIHIRNGDHSLDILVFEHNQNTRMEKEMESQKGLEVFISDKDKITINGDEYYLSKYSGSYEFIHGSENKAGLTGFISLSEVHKTDEDRSKYIEMLKDKNGKDYIFIKLQNNTNGEKKIDTPEAIQNDIIKILESISW